MKSHTGLLPNGLLDILSPQAETESRLIETFMREFSMFGYARVKPPLIEFEESLLGEGPGQALARQTFRVMDPLSGRMMGVRADVTAQIARISASRLGHENRPLRLSYAADVLRVQGTQLRPERQFCQVGCELIGTDHAQSDVEIPLVAIKALHAAGVGGLSIDLTFPTLLDHLIAESKLSSEQKEHLVECVERRDRDGALSMGGDASKIIALLMEDEGSLESAKEKLKSLSLPPKANADMQKLLAVAGDLSDALKIYGLQDIQITLDPLERRGFEYQTGLSFTLFARGARGELGRGGRYDITNAHGTETATGFTLYMDTILPVTKPLAMKEARIVKADEGWKEIKSLQDQGIAVKRAG